MLVIICLIIDHINKYPSTRSASHNPNDHSYFPNIVQVMMTMIPNNNFYYL